MGSPRIGLFGHYGLRNLGDEAIIAAIIQNLRRICPDAVLYGFSANPRDTAARYGICAYPIRRGRDRACDAARTRSKAPPPVAQARWSGARSGLSMAKAVLKRVPLLPVLVRSGRRLTLLPRTVFAECRFLGQAYRTLDSVDALLICGSNQFLDNWGGAWGYPYTLLKWSILAKLRRRKLMYASVGAGPIDSMWSRALIRIALLFADYISFRDDGSKAMIEIGGFRERGPVVPDLAHSLALPDVPPRATRHVRPTVAINPMAMYDERYWCRPDRSRYREYVDKMAIFASQLVRRGYPVFFFSTQFRDEATIADILASMAEDARRRLDEDAVVRSSRSVEELMRVIAAADIVVATRFHGVLLALHAGKPVLGVCYYRKAQELLAAMGQGAYAVPFDTFEVGQLWSAFASLEANRQAAIDTISRVDAEYREALDRQYRHVLSLATRSLPREYAVVRGQLIVATAEAIEPQARQIQHRD